MSDELTTAASPDDAETQLRLARARRVDPAASDPSLSRFWDEIAEASAALDLVDAANVSLPIAFSPAWPDQEQT